MMMMMMMGKWLEWKAYGGAEGKEGGKILTMRAKFE